VSIQIPVGTPAAKIAIEISPHALERARERFAYRGMEDGELSDRMRKEVAVAIETGRVSFRKPALLRGAGTVGKGGVYAWNPRRTRGFVLGKRGGWIYVKTVVERRAA